MLKKPCIGMSQITKAAALSLAATTILFAAATTASGASRAKCSQSVQNVRDIAANIAGSANTYWVYRRNFADFSFGRSSKIANAKVLADAQLSQAGQSKALMPSNLTNFRAALATARYQNCLSAAESRTIDEIVTTHARNVNFDQFPVDAMETTSRPGPTRMPR
jgi:hypothetical protein